MNSSTSGMPVSKDRVRILKSDRTRLTISARTMPSTSPEGWFDTTTRGPVAGMRAISTGGVSMRMPMVADRLGPERGAERGAGFLEAADQAKKLDLRGQPFDHPDRAGLPGILERSGIGKPPHVILAVTPTGRRCRRLGGDLALFCH